jgi:hypothetical protein
MSVKFYNSAIKRRIGLDELIKEIISYINDVPNANYQITVGTDSPGVENPFFVTAVTILRIGNGGRYFWTKSERIQCHNLQERIYKEAMQSITLAQELKSRLRDFGEEFFWDNKISVHIDIGRNGPTRNLIEGVMGMVKGYGLEAVIKPDAFCACVVADKYT